VTHHETDAVRSAIARLTPQWWQRHGSRIDVEVTGGAPDQYRCAADGERLRISGNTAGSALTGFREYLESTGTGHLSRAGDRISDSDRLVLPAEPLQRTNPYRYRYAYNLCVPGYTTPYWHWEDWERELDLIAASGVNLALITVGCEAVWLDTFREFGYQDEEILAWISLPAHQPWQWLGNLAGYGGGVSTRLVEQRADLGRQIMKRMRELDIEPVLPGFSGVVPDGFGDRNPGAVVVAQGDWNGFARPDWLDPRDDSFARLAASFYRAQLARFGDCRMQAVDLLHEGGRTAAVPLGIAAQRIAAAMAAAHPDYIWVIQGWQDNPRADVLADLPHDHLLVLDLMGGTGPGDGTPWLWGTLPNFGGRFGLHGPLPGYAAFPSMTSQPRPPGLHGTAFTSESIQTNPVVWSLFTDTSWHDQDIEVDDWIVEYARRRYGSANKHAARAWLGLLSTVYRGREGTPGGADSVLCAIPDLAADKASIAAPGYLPYPPEPLEVAWRDLQMARGSLADVDTYRYDLVDVTRQVISNRARVMLPMLRTAYAARDLARFASLQNSFMELFDLLDPVLATRTEFMLGPWLSAARSHGGDDAEADALEYDARSLVTSWGDTAANSAILRDYANREWSGLIADFYRPRWARYLESLHHSVDTGLPPEKVDFVAEAVAWSRRTDRYPTQPSGDSVAAARAVHHALPYFEGLP
jgi:hypothetical protein